MTVGSPVPRDDRADEALIDRWRQRGDEAAASELVRRHSRALARFLHGGGAVDDEVEDLVQETFFRAFRGIETYRGTASFRTWVFSIGSNVLRDAWRKRTRRPVIPIGDRDFVDERADPHGMSQARDLEEQFGESVRKLPGMQRDVFLMRAQQGVGYDEIAQVLSTTVGAARVHYHHAVKRLQRLMDPEGLRRDDD